MRFFSPNTDVLTPLRSNRVLIEHPIISKEELRLTASLSAISFGSEGSGINVSADFRSARSRELILPQVPRPAT